MYPRRVQHHCHDVRGTGSLQQIGNQARRLELPQKKRISLDQDVGCSWAYLPLSIQPIFFRTNAYGAGVPVEADGVILRASLMSDQGITRRKVSMV